MIDFIVKKFFVTKEINDAIYTDCGKVGDYYISKLMIDGVEYISEVPARLVESQGKQSSSFRFYEDNNRFQKFGFILEF